MRKKISLSKYYKFIVYLAVVVLINLAGITLFARMDLTENNIYSLSDVSEEVVATLSEPLTIKVFFSRDLPAPYNNVERYLRDLLDEYAVSGGRYFNYQFYEISGEEDAKSKENQDLAGNYGIYPIQLQSIEHDEVKFQKAYMGMVLIHGDIIEKIPTITSTDNLEYQITSSIRKMNNKISALLRLDDKIEVKLFLSSSPQAVGPYMDLQCLPELPGKIEEVVDKLNEKNYGRLAFSHLDPTLRPEDEKEADDHDILSLQWKDFKDRRGQDIKGDRGYAGLIVEHGDRSEEIQVLRVMRIPIFGTQYKLMDPEELETALNGAVENVIDINEKIGYLADHGTPPLNSGFSMPGQQQDEESLGNFDKLVSEDYSVSEVRLKDEGIPDDLSFLMIAGAKKTFTDYELYQIDQFLMKGKSLAIFLDAFNEVQLPGQQNRMNQKPIYMPLKTGLEKLLDNYGLSLKESIILDENCFKQRVPQMYGGGERPFYFAPVVKNEFINKDRPFLENIKGLVMLKPSPVEIDEQKMEEDGLEATRLFASSERSWEMAGKIDLNPMMMSPPADEDEFESMPMAYVVEGSFPSYFAGQPIPEKEEGVSEEDSSGTTEEAGVNMSEIKGEGVTIEKGKPGRIFLIGTSEIIKDNILDEDGKSPNAQFVLNVIDYLNGREGNAVMRSKTQRFNPLRDIGPGAKTAIKTSNIAGLPLLVIFAGLIVWLRRTSRKRTIQEIFRK